MLGVDAIKGFTTWRKESTHNVNSDMLLIGMSANASLQDQNEAFKAGMHFFASKPVDINVLSLLIENKKEYLDLNRTIANLRTLALSSEDTSDVYCTQKCNLRSPPISSNNVHLQHSPSTPCEARSHTKSGSGKNDSRLGLYVTGKSNSPIVCEEESRKIRTESLMSSTYSNRVG